MRKISIVIPTFNNAKTIEQCLQSLKEQTIQSDEIIIVDGHSTDETLDIIKQFECKLVFEERGSRAAACNIGVPEAEGEIIAFIDADAIAKKDWLENIIKAFDITQDRNVVCVTGPNIEYPNETFFGKAVSAIYNTFIGGNWTEHIESIFNLKPRFVESAAGCNSAYKKEILNEVMPFNESLLTTEDTDINYRLRKKGYNIFFEPGAIVYHQRPQNHKSYRNKAKKYARGKIQFFRAHNDGLEIGHLLPPLYFITGIFLALIIPANYWVSIGVAFYLGFYLLAIISFSLLQSIRYKKWKYTYLLPIMFIEGHIWWSLGILQEIFRPMKK